MNSGKPRPGPTPPIGPEPTGGKPTPLDEPADGMRYGAQDEVYRPTEGVPTPDDEESPDA